MKLLFDQNLSPRLVSRLAHRYPGSAHVSALGLARARDVDVWEQARVGGYAIVSKDSDFSEISLLRGFPPKVIWIRRGNCSTQEIEALLRQHHAPIKELSQNEQAGILVLH